jgi:phosphoribosylformylglycinamidine synthase
VYVEKKEGFDTAARGLLGELADFLGVSYPELGRLKGLRVLNRYDLALPPDAVPDPEGEVKKIAALVLGEPRCDRVFYGEAVPAEGGDRYFAVEYLPGQYDQRSDSAEQCAELVTGIRPKVRSARIYILSPGEGGVSEAALDAVKHHLINPVDSREAALEMPKTLDQGEDNVSGVPLLGGFREAEPADLAAAHGLAMSAADLACCQAYFKREGRDPTLAELRVLDTYWSDHCRHTTFTTVLRDITVEEGPPALGKALALYEEARRELYGEAPPPPSLMDMATLGGRVLKKRGLLPDLDESGEINACSLRIQAEFSDGSAEPWLLLFKNETHNHPTEIEPFGGAATCLGGAIRDPLSGRAYVHQAMRISGGGDPRAPLSETLPGKLPQLRIAREAAAGYSSYGNQIGLAAGQVCEFYHPGFLAKRMELGAVIAAVPEVQVRREEPAEGDVVVLVGGKTGRDGIGGATGSSKAHTGESVKSAGAEVQKGNAVEERKLQRLFRNPRFTALIKRCNDFGAGGVSVAVGELAAGLDINLDRVPKKYAGLDGIELALSESQERMAVVCAGTDADTLTGLAAGENLDAVVIAAIRTGGDPRLRMTWRGETIVNLSRDFLNSSGAPRSAAARLPGGMENHTKGLPDMDPDVPSPGSPLERLERELGSLRSASRRGLQERFDGSIGAASVLFPWGGKEQGTPECGMVSLLPALEKESLTASLMTFGYDPDLMERNPYEGAKGSVREALAKFACLGGNPWKARLSLQEYFERPEDPLSWGRPAAALLGALEAQLTLGVPAIGGKDSMSGSYRDLAGGIDIAVPPTLVAFAAGTAPAAAVHSGALSGEAGNTVILLNHAGGPGEWEIFRANMDALGALSAAGLIRSAWPVGPGGAAASLAIMAFGNMTGLETYAGIPGNSGGYQGSVLAEVDGNSRAAAEEILKKKGARWTRAAETIAEPLYRIRTRDGAVSAETPLTALRRVYESPLIRVYPQTAAGHTAAETVKPGDPADIRGAAEGDYKPAVLRRSSPSRALPLVVLPVFPGTNCEWDMERAFREAGGKVRQVVFRNRNREDIAESSRTLARAIGEAQIVALPGGFSAGDEPDGSGKFIANVFRAPVVAEAVTALLEKRDGLILGICNGFQALIKLGLVPYGAYREADGAMPVLTFNRLGRHVSRMVRTRVMPNNSPWLALDAPGTVHILPVSHGEGRLVIREEEARALFAAGQIPCCYADEQGRPAMTEPDNPNGSDFAIEALTSPNGRILGKMGHSERRGKYVHINIPGNKRMNIFEAGIAYFR